METDFKIAVLVLAAGASRRMNDIKQILAFKDSTLLENALKTAKVSKNDQVFCVLGANKEEIQQKVDFQGIEIIQNDNWNNGLGKSIAVGIEAIQNYKDYDGILVMLGDQPFISSEYLNKMIEKFIQNQSDIVATSYSGKPGVPALFPQKIFSELTKLSGDSGAKELLRGEKNIVKLEAENTFDVDSPEDYKKVLRF
ncbi:nucleotidyltransferase family protein [Zunongwangia sp. SCSIO 43204]|uniref:nucleotidyltransferase family protein n=1 Tax=Zunongwangia sp. SCSIO 43204 TaxID=2779359 RepID=UPI001CA9F3A3|nr:nucleotidyltransferase family protein [Zunongwangia sp. SCSIO 43204]UAB82627.1 nucleotidyltransferase family protein [Zunongwangia sp. SCSIO 43204]